MHGRWHTRGHLVTYATEHPATAQLEWLVHLDITRVGDAPITIPFSEIEIPDDLVSSETITESDLPMNWRDNFAATQHIGDAWIDSRATLLLFVPSAIAPARNVLLNPAHSDASKIRIVNVFDYPFDERLLKDVT